jgi:signal transduction histidine kinase/CheY-like chemotaxis protein
VAESLARQRPATAVDEIQRQNQELLRALEELSQRQDELVGLNRELEDTNRGVVALYAELDERADHLRRADEVKSKFLSNMSHEFRTPVNSIMALARMLLDRTDGDLSEEQERQVRFISDAATSLSELVNDLLDLAKAQAGKVVVHPVEFEVGNLFGALRGMLRPLLLNESVSLVFEEPEAIPLLFTDESKVSQIVRNFVSNALKFTERGEVRGLGAAARRRHDRIRRPRTGMGIAPEDHERIFQEFTQLDSPVQRRVKGTGLGLPLCRRLAELLGRHSDRGQRAGRRLHVHGDRADPLRTAGDRARVGGRREPHPRAGRRRLARRWCMLYERYLTGTPGIKPARRPHAARGARGDRRDVTARDHPRHLLRGEDAWEFLAELKRRPDTAELPIMVVSTSPTSERRSRSARTRHLEKPVERDRLLGVLRDLTRPARLHRILVVDDEEISRYVLRQHLAGNERQVVEAESGAEALRRVRDDRPDVVCLDLGMPDLDGFEVLRRLKADPDTCGIPVVVVTARELTLGERTMLDEMAAGVLSKHTVSRESTLAMIAAWRAGEADDHERAARPGPRRRRQRCEALPGHARAAGRGFEVLEARRAPTRCGSRATSRPASWCSTSSCPTSTGGRCAAA